MNSIQKFILPSFFVVSALDTIFTFFGFATIAKLSMSYLVVVIYLVVKSIEFWKISDYLIAIFLFIIAFYGLISDTPPQLLKTGLRYQLLLTIYFYLGRYYLSSDRIFIVGKYVMLVMAVVSLMLYFFQPSWYIALKTESSPLDASSQVLYLELMRLTGFSSYPYWISYGCCIIFIYYVSSTFNSKKTNPTLFDYLFLSILFVTTLLTEQRAPIVVSILYLLLYIAYTNYASKRLVITRPLILLGLAIIVSYCVVQYVSSDQLTHLFEKFNMAYDKNTNLVEQRINQSMLSNDKISFWGDGIGLYGHEALKFNKSVIADQQYLKIIFENGLSGLVGYCCIFLFVLYNGFKNLRYYLCEVGIVVFFLLSMFGANSLSMENYHSPIFWLCCGRILNHKCLIYKKYILWEK